MRDNLFRITLTAGVLACLMLMGTGGAEAMVFIDTFNNGEQDMVVTMVGTSKINQVGDVAGVLGGYRDSRLHLVTDSNQTANIRLEIDVNDSNIGELLTSVFGGGHVHITYDGEDTTTVIQEGTTGIPPGNLMEDFTGKNMFQLDITGIDTGTWDVSLTVFDNFGNAAQVSRSVATTGKQTWSFSEFTDVLFTDVKAIRFEIENDVVAGDISWDTLHAFNNIPEPGTLVLLGLGVLGIFGYGWRRRKATK